MGCFVLHSDSISPRVTPSLPREAEVMLGCSNSLLGLGNASACRKLALLAAGALSRDDFLHPSLQLCYRAVINCVCTPLSSYFGHLHAPECNCSSVSGDIPSPHRGTGCAGGRAGTASASAQIPHAQRCSACCF